jgi:hypothetical protein
MHLAARRLALSVSVALAGCGNTTPTAAFSGGFTGTAAVFLGDYGPIEYPAPWWGLAITTDAGAYPELDFGIQVAGTLQTGKLTSDNTLFVESNVEGILYGPYWRQAFVSGDLAGDEGSFDLTINSTGADWADTHGTLTLVLVPEFTNRSAANVNVEVNF